MQTQIDPMETVIVTVALILLFGPDRQMAWRDFTSMFRR